MVSNIAVLCPSPSSATFSLSLSLSLARSLACSISTLSEINIKYILLIDNTSIWALLIYQMLLKWLFILICFIQRMDSLRHQFIFRHFSFKRIYQLISLIEYQLISEDDNQKVKLIEKINNNKKIFLFAFTLFFAPLSPPSLSLYIYIYR